MSLLRGLRCTSIVCRSGAGHSRIPVCSHSLLVSYPDPDSHSCGWITSPLRGKRVWRTAVLNSVHGHQNVGEPIRFEVCNNCISSLLTRVYWECVWSLGYTKLKDEQLTNYLGLQVWPS